MHCNVILKNGSKLRAPMDGISVLEKTDDLSDSEPKRRYWLWLFGTPIGELDEAVAEAIRSALNSIVTPAVGMGLLHPFEVDFRAAESQGGSS